LQIIPSTSHSATKAMGSDVVPSEDDPRF